MQEERIFIDSPDYSVVSAFLRDLFEIGEIASSKVGAGNRSGIFAGSSVPLG